MMTSYTLLRNSTPIVQPATVTAHRLNLRRSKSIDWKQAKTIRRARKAGMRIIGQVAGHEINLEIEGVQDKKVFKVDFRQS